VRRFFYRQGAKDAKNAKEKQFVFFLFLGALCDLGALAVKIASQATS
jgi:hypothetical protein